ncbi:MAG: hypothetical protein FWE32_06330 [Oscillospiraceae bacterium]|nr:hypothetical protein [Oscillospiraceae bacterium]
MNGPLSLSKLLDSKRFVLVLAVLVAVISWLTVAMTTSDTLTLIITDVPVDIEMQSGFLVSRGLAFWNIPTITADVEVNGARTVVGNLRAEDFNLTVDVNHVHRPDTWELRVVVSQNQALGDFEIEQITPRQPVMVRVDQVDSRIFEIDLEITGPNNTTLAAAPGFMIDSPRLTPSSDVMITGARSDLERVYRAVVRHELDDPLNSPYIEDLPIILLDMAGNEIDLSDRPMQLDYENLTLQIPVLRVETLPLVVDFQNVPLGFPEAQLRGHMRQSSQNITIAGPISTMQNFDIWRLGFINLRQLTAEQNFFVFDVTLPSEQFINIDDIQSVIFEFDAENWDRAVFNIPAEDIMIHNQPAGVEVTLQSAALNGVILVGDAEELAGLAVSDIVVEVNLNDRELTMGLQPFPVRVSVPNRGMIWPVEEGGNFTIYINVIEA